MVELWALLPAEQAAALQARVNEIAAGAATTSGPITDHRTTDQRRADALAGLATAGANAEGDAGLRPAVHVTVALSTLLELDRQPGGLAGYGPISSALARAIAFDTTGTWRRLVTDEHGDLVDVSSISYRPPAPMRSFVQLRDGVCRFPGCSRAAARCELDHVRAWADGGATSPANLILLCPPATTT